ncbi:MAG: SDR family NAD(P)-dependent oxidoreductase [Pseudomonadota bacterium]
MSETKVAVITGSTGGIGDAIAEQLAASGWVLTLVNRNMEKAQHQKANLLSEHPGTRVDLIQADLLDVVQIQKAAAEILALHPKIDALYNNSGVLTSQRVISKQGHESNYAVNTLAPYVMIKALQSALARGESDAKAMIVNTTSSAQNAAKSLDVGALSDPSDIGGLTGVYATTKLALTTMGAAIAPALENDGILLRSICPGPVITPMTKTSDAMPGILKLLVPILFKKPEKQAAKMISAAQPESCGGRTGIYLTNGREKPLPKLALDASLQSQLMKKLSEDAMVAETAA